MDDRGEDIPQRFPFAGRPELKEDFEVVGPPRLGSLLEEVKKEEVEREEERAAGRAESQVAAGKPETERQREIRIFGELGVLEAQDTRNRRELQRNRERRQRRNDFLQGIELEAKEAGDRKKQRFFRGLRIQERKQQEDDDAREVREIEVARTGGKRTAAEEREQKEVDAPPTPGEETADEFQRRKEARIRKALSSFRRVSSEVDLGEFPSDILGSPSGSVPPPAAARARTPPGAARAGTPPTHTEDAMDSYFTAMREGFRERRARVAAQEQVQRREQPGVQREDIEQKQADISDVVAGVRALGTPAARGIFRVDAGRVPLMDEREFARLIMRVSTIVGLLDVPARDLTLDQIRAEAAATLIAHPPNTVTRAVHLQLTTLRDQIRDADTDVERARRLLRLIRGLIAPPAQAPVGARETARLRVHDTLFWGAMANLMDEFRRRVQATGGDVAGLLRKDPVTIIQAVPAGQRLPILNDIFVAIAETMQNVSPDEFRALFEQTGGDPATIQTLVAVGRAVLGFLLKERERKSRLQEPAAVRPGPDIRRDPDADDGDGGHGGFDKAPRIDQPSDVQGSTAAKDKEDGGAGKQQTGHGQKEASAGQIAPTDKRWTKWTASRIVGQPRPHVETTLDAQIDPSVVQQAMNNFVYPLKEPGALQLAGLFMVGAMTKTSALSGAGFSAIGKQHQALTGGNLVTLAPHATKRLTADGKRDRQNPIDVNRAIKVAHPSERAVLAPLETEYDRVVKPRMGETGEITHGAIMNKFKLFHSMKTMHPGVVRQASVTHTRDAQQDTDNLVKRIRDTPIDNGHVHRALEQLKRHLNSGMRLHEAHEVLDSIHAPPTKRVKNRRRRTRLRGGAVPMSALHARQLGRHRGRVSVGGSFRTHKQLYRVDGDGALSPTNTVHPGGMYRNFPVKVTTGGTFGGTAEHGPQRKEPSILRKKALEINDDNVPPHLQGMRSKMKTPSRHFHHFEHEYRMKPHHRAAMVGGGLFDDIGHAFTSTAKSVASGVSSAVDATGSFLKKQGKQFVDSAETLGKSVLQTGKNLVSGEAAAGKNIAKFFDHPSMKNLGSTLEGVGQAVIAPTVATAQGGGAAVNFLQSTPGIREANIAASIYFPPLGFAEAGLGVADKLSREDYLGALVTGGVAVAGQVVGRGVGAIAGKAIGQTSKILSRFSG